MSRRDKAHRILTEGRLHVLAESLACIVEGDTGRHRVDIYERDGTVVCECDCAYWKHHPVRADCSHVLAALRVANTLPKGEGDGRE